MNDLFRASSEWRFLLTANILVAILAAICSIALHNFGRGEMVNARILGFFHPHCDSGGGGERVLWVMIHALLKEVRFKERLKIVIYAVKGNKHKKQILSAVRDSFGVDVTEHSERITFVPISSTALLDAKWYPVATMLFQSLASILVGLECLIHCAPDMYCDTMGAAFIYPLAKVLFGCVVVTYTHYPIISSDMLQRVREQRPAHNNDSIISSSVSISAAKLAYYQLFAYAYTIVGSFADKVIVNSSWTENHISQLWRLRKDQREEKLPQDSTQKSINYDGKQRSRQRCTKSLIKMYPPCNTAHLQGIPLGDQKSRKRIVLSIGQFRPEKDHSLQLRAMRALLDLDTRYADVRLVLVGSTRNEDDRALVRSLKDEVIALRIDDHVSFLVNAPFSELYGLLGEAQVGLHTMWNEHFGISIVEMMAAGLVTVAHKSGGPLMDLIKPADILVDASSTSESISTGYLATTATEYAACIGAALDTYVHSLPLRERARISSLRYSDEVFEKRIVEELSDIILG